MQVTALLVAVLLIGFVAAQTTAPTRPPGPGFDVTAKQCFGATCTGLCDGFTTAGGVCHQSRRNNTQYESLYCNENGVCMSLQIYMGAGCNGRVFPSRRIANQCDGANACPFRWSSFNYLGNFRLQINFNCTSDCTTGCELEGIVDTRSCWNLGKISGTVDSIDSCRWINADLFQTNPSSGSTCSRNNVVVRNSIEENVCFVEFGGIGSSTYQCEGAPPPKGAKVIKTAKKL